MNKKANERIINYTPLLTIIFIVVALLVLIYIFYQLFRGGFGGG
jgi:type VI protein secretion system component VasF